MSKANKQLKQDQKRIEDLKKEYKKSLIELKKSINEEERNINLFQQERERINYTWMLQKKKIEEAQAELINKQREKEDLKEKHSIEQKLYMQKIKYIMLKHQDENVELQKNAEIALKQLEDIHRVKEKEYKYDVRTLSKIHKEQEVLQNDFVNALEKDNIKSLHELKGEYELKESQIRKFHREKMKEIINNNEEKRRKLISEITEKKAKEIKALTDEHANRFNDMKNYYSELNKKNLTELKNLANEFKKQLIHQNELKNKKANSFAKKKKNEEPLNKLLQENKKLLDDEKMCIENFDDLRRKNDEYKNLMKELLESEYKYEVTFQKILFLEKEKESFIDKFKDKLNLVEQKSGLRNLILEKKLELIEDNLEIKEVQLKELLKKTSLDPSAIANINITLEEVELMKGELINQLEDELHRIKEAHINMIKTYEAKLAEFGIPQEEMGFEPLIPYDIKKSN